MTQQAWKPDGGGNVLRLNPALDRKALAEAFARDGFVQIENLFPDDVANAMEAVLANRTPWRTIFTDNNGQVRKYRPHEMAALPVQQSQQLQQGIFRKAREGFAFLYHYYPMIETLQTGEDAGHPLHQMVQFLNMSEWLDFGREIIGCDTVNRSDAQATLYAPGDFLTRHDDSYGDVVDRRAAFVIGFTREWKSDWGGQLVFYDGDAVIERAFQPRFNVVTFFKVPRWHAVTYVAPFAGAGRYSITGWLDHGRVDVPG
ncbi:2OG-Fe(II) oxygenase [Hyphobacterium marinum]|uniref:2OG-Fe(II) oxygenase family protein n=1 Tax=Hyphobacterium marinum TaxID=3116574 RepID=A0ABU7M2P0_9PROT|nr:2OG-Fe(II) oxygenase family protein [Hyphobacterium sp. Y6023]MEE2567670.1 2OG-Fe(II) oxygenase family protein [Hyphobacterium sp. Y6023]